MTETVDADVVILLAATAVSGLSYSSSVVAAVEEIHGAVMAVAAAAVMTAVSGLSFFSSSVED